MPEATQQFHDVLMKRSQEIAAEGFEFPHAFGRAWLEYRIKHLEWPSDWGDNLMVLLYGDFQPPSTDLEFPSLGITVFHEKQENTVVRSSICVLKAQVSISERTVSGITDAIRRLNVLLGSWTLASWGNSGCGWWSYITHGSGGGGYPKFEDEHLPLAVDGILRLPTMIRQKVDAALYWIREPRNSMLEAHRSDLLRIYAAYWNAFECLVDAVLMLRPREKLTQSEKQERIDAFIRERNGRLSSSDIAKCYQETVNPGFKAKASHVLRICCPDDADMYINECFELLNRQNRLYDIRNAINHGEIDAENPEELLRVEARLHKLWMIVWRIFGRLVPFPAPLERPRRPEKGGIST